MFPVANQVVQQTDQVVCTTLKDLVRTLVRIDGRYLSMCLHSQSSYHDDSTGDRNKTTQCSLVVYNGFATHYNPFHMSTQADPHIYIGLHTWQ